MNVMSELGRSSRELEKLVEWNPSAGSDAFFSASLDSVTGTVRAVGGGAWRPEDVERYFADQRRVLEQARARFGRLKVFFDIRNWLVEGPQSATQFQDANGKLYIPDDRLVTLVGSSLYKQYSRTALNVGSPEAFLSSSAAETWLHAYTPSRLVA